MAVSDIDSLFECIYPTIATNRPRKNSCHPLKSAFFNVTDVYHKVNRPANRVRKKTGFVCGSCKMKILFES